MEKIKFTVQVVMLVLALPVWFITEMKRMDKVIKAQEINRVDSIPVNKKMSSNAGKAAGSIYLNTASLEELMFINN